MEDKVQKIREEVVRLKSQLLKGACSSQVAMETRCKEEAYDEVLSFIDSLQEEPKKCMYAQPNYTDEDRKALCDGCREECKYAQKEEPNWLQEFRCKLDSLSKEDFEKVFDKYAIDFNEEPISEDLEEAAKEHAVERFRTTRDEFLAEKCKWSFKAGAQWQKEQNNKK